MKLSAILLAVLAGAVAARPILVSKVEARQDVGSAVGERSQADTIFERIAGQAEPVKGGRGKGLPPSKKSVRAASAAEKPKGGKGNTLPPS